MQRRYEIIRVNVFTHEPQPNPIMEVTADSWQHARDKANRLLLNSGRARGFDLAWTQARDIGPALPN